MSGTEGQPVSGPAPTIRELIPWALDTFKVPEGRLRRTAGAVALGASLVPVAKKAQEHVRGRLAWSVAVSDQDDLYHELHQWLLDQIPENRRRHLQAGTIRRSGNRVTSPDTPVAIGAHDEPPVQELAYRYDSSRSQTVRLDGHRILVAIEEIKYDAPNVQDRTTWTRKPEQIRLTAYSPAGRAAIDRFLRRITEARFATGRTPKLHLAGRWGGWDQRSDLPTRSIETVALPAGQMDQLLDDLQRFLAEEAVYARLGVPWHRGYLLTGPPGTGKSSIIRAAASHLGLDLYYVPLGDMNYDVSLLQLLSNVAPRSAVLFEDIDVLTAASHARDESPGSTEPKVNEGVTLSGLLNALDGVTTPHGLITFVTTNKPEALDDALTRPGRMDVRMDVTYCTVDQVAQLWATAFPDHRLELPEQLTAEVTPADVVGILKNQVRDVDAAAVYLSKLLEADCTILDAH